MSYHLRQLEKHGIVREVAGKGTARERWWERRPGSISTPEPREFPPGSPERLAARPIEDEWNRGREETFHEFLRDGEDVFDDDWLNVVAVDTINLRLTPQELQGLVKDIDEVLWRYIDRYRATPTAGARPVQMQLTAFPLVRGEAVGGPGGDASDVGGRDENQTETRSSRDDDE